MNRLFRTEGIVLKSMKLNEADKIVTIYSCDYGKIRGIARGVRKTRSQFGSSMENLTIIKVLLYKGKNINTISQSEIISSFFPQTKDLFQYGIAIQCAEIVDKLTADEDPNRRVYTLFKKFLLLLKDEKNPVLLIESFKWKLISLLGYEPELKRCIHCHNVLNNSSHYFFDIKKGGVSCISCLDKQGYYQIKIRNYHLKLLQRILNADLEKIHNKEIEQSVLHELGKITDAYLAFHLEVENKSRYFINRIQLL
ncbi:MAG: DNA repair protein RecO [Bacteroidales bacterium]|jgi:DNA repair protein RecO (recombination protein O)|nr:DNA repair protein RecO [Bacteroidales bacterium]